MKTEYELTEWEEEHLIIQGWKLYTLIAVCILSLSVISYNAYTARSEANKANTQLNQANTSVGAKIEVLLNKRTDNKKQWWEEQKKIDLSIKKQEQLNVSTQKVEDELVKYNISVIN